MGRILAVMGALLLLGSLGTLFAVPAPTPSSQPTVASSTMSLWEAYSRGFISIRQIDLTFNYNGQPQTGPLGYEVRNTGTVPVSIDERAVLLSPNPRESRNPSDTTQDGILTFTTIAPGGVVAYGYGDYVAQGFLPGPAWWCSEDFQYVKAGISITLGGEIAPFDLNALLSNVQVGTQQALWDHLASVPTLVVGKTVNGTFWRQVPEFPAQSLVVDLRATNIAVKNTQDAQPDADAPNARVWDIVPAGYTIDTTSIHPTGYTTAAMPDGSMRISWNAAFPAADVTGKAAGTTPTPYVSRSFGYTMLLPHLAPGRAGLPRAQISVGADFTSEANSEQPVIDVTRVELPPVPNAGSGYAGFEGDTLAFSAAASTDPNGDPLTFRWDFTADGTWDTAWSPDPTASMTFGDDFAGSVRVEVSDGTMSRTATAPVLVQNVDPTLGDVRATAVGNLTLRVAGEKWHDVTLYVNQSGVSRQVSVVRMPGSPDRQAATLADVEIDVAQDLSIVLVYTPADDPVNGQPNGANPVWVIFNATDGEVRLHHTFNVRHPDTWVWTLDDVAPQLIGMSIRAAAGGSDVGSDDLTFTVDWGDGTTTSATVYNDGVGPDPYPSVDGTPIATTQAFAHAYTAAGTYTVRVTLMDDDGGSVTTDLVLRVG